MKLTHAHSTLYSMVYYSGAGLVEGRRFCPILRKKKSWTNILSVQEKTAEVHLLFLRHCTSSCKIASFLLSFRLITWVPFLSVTLYLIVSDHIINYSVLLFIWLIIHRNNELSKFKKPSSILEFIWSILQTRYPKWKRRYYWITSYTERRY